MSKPVVSIIIPVYNTESYLEACINSALIQLDGNVELIIVDDGSTDNSVKICREAAEKYSNIRVFQQQNSGPGMARNLGISLAQGKYIFFLDSDDLIPPNSLRVLLDIAETYCSDITCGLLYSFNSKKTWLLPTLQSFEKLTAFNLNLASIPVLQQHISPCGKLYNRNFILNSGFEFLRECHWGEDAYFVLNLMRLAKGISLVPQMVYKYRVRDSTGQVSLTSVVTPRIFSDLERVTRLLNQDFEHSDTPYSKKIRDLHYCRSMRYHLERFTRSGANMEAMNEVYSSCQIFLCRIPDVTLNVFEPINALIFELIRIGEFDAARRLFKGERGASFMNSILALPSVQNETRVMLFVAKVSLAIFGDKEISGVSKPAAPKAPFSKNKNSIVHKPVNVPSDWKMKVYLATVLSIFPRLFNGSIWLIGERMGGSVQDTGFKFFSWVKRNTKTSAYFVTKPGNIYLVPKDLRRYVLRYGSLKHFVYFFASRAYVYNDSYKDIFHHWQRLVDNQAVPNNVPGVFLQHGVIATSKIHGYYDYSTMIKRNQPADIFIVSSEREKKFVTNGLGHPFENVVVAGLSRFDDLPIGAEARKLAKKKILFVPTWRNWLRWNTDNAFLDSEFYQEIFAWLRSPELEIFLKKNNLELELLLHHAFSKYVRYFEEIVSDHVCLSDMDNCNVQAKLIEAGMLVTDYSSIGFDFAYMGKPVIYFQFDRHDFLVARGGSFINMESDLPGPVVATPSALKSEIEKIVDSDWIVDKNYSEISNLFFTNRDHKNSERIHNAICHRLSFK